MFNDNFLNDYYKKERKKNNKGLADAYAELVKAVLDPRNNKTIINPYNIKKAIGKLIFI